MPTLPSNPSPESEAAPVTGDQHASALSASEQPTSRQLNAIRLSGSGTSAPVLLDTIEEVPIAFSYGGIAHGVMMASPTDLDDFAVGFTVTEGIASGPGDIRQVEIRLRDDGCEVDTMLAPEAFHAFLARRRVRSLRGHTSCGLCGVEDLVDVARADLAQRRTAIAASATPVIELEAMRNALESLRNHQPLSRRTHAAHAAGWATLSGEIVLVREDVGRHSALDKLIGACLRNGIDVADGFCVITSRCSYEMVQKTVAAGMRVLVAVSAPTALAVRSAESAGLTLVASARSDAQVVYAGANRILTIG
ncbi:MAG TPA: formate dehydrogenase accessory sulfurtransferase FdhD [Devosiaceae bacterium]|nr:formate dehydrogenase accessory sulfurtransferase FdhD [Devosiaceae bacterium]